MGKKRTVLKVSISSKKCQQEILSAVAKIPGIEKLEIDVNKGTLTVTGEVEPVPIFKALKKIGKNPEIMTVGPPRSEKCGPGCYCNSCRPNYDQQNTAPKRNYDKQNGWWGPPKTNPCHPCCNQSCCKQCELVSVGYSIPYGPNPGQCSIM